MFPVGETEWCRRNKRQKSYSGDSGQPYHSGKKTKESQKENEKPHCKEHRDGEAEREAWPQPPLSHGGSPTGDVQTGLCSMNTQPGG